MSYLPALGVFVVGTVAVCAVQERDVPFVVPFSLAVLTAVASTGLLAWAGVLA